MLLALAGLNALALRRGLLPDRVATMERRVAYRLGLRHAATLAAVSMATAGSAAGPPPATQLGINLVPPSFLATTRPFANIAIGNGWALNYPGQSWTAFPPEDLDRDGNLLRIPAGASAILALTPPNTGPEGAAFRCTYHGKGEVGGLLGATEVSSRPGELKFRWQGKRESLPPTLVVTKMDPADPVRDVDCREAKTPPDVRFTPAYVAFVGQFKVLRFMDWARTNDNAPVTWATRHTPHTMNTGGADGISIEDMVALATQAHTDAWFNVPWNADDDYVRHFAQLVHDTLPADRTAYVELSNEVWNTAFAQGQQAVREGQERGLATDPNVAKLFRYAQRMVEVMDIWQRAFADRPSRLVRVAASQNSVPYTADAILGFRDAARHVDALATAPYFNFDVGGSMPVANVDEAFAKLPARVDRAITTARDDKDVADKYGKRYLTYEAGQHIIVSDVALEQAIQRDPRMYDIYKRYIDGWRARVGDTMVLFASVYPIGQFGAWGLLEYDGQPAANAPKWRAVQEELKR